MLIQLLMIPDNTLVVLGGTQTLSKSTAQRRNGLKSQCQMQLLCLLALQFLVRKELSETDVTPLSLYLLDGIVSFVFEMT